MNFVIKNIILENFKAFKYVRIGIKPITIFVGPNNGGKTSFLQSISLMQQTLRGSNDELLNFKNPINFGEFDNIIHQNADNKEVRFRFEFENNNYFDVKIFKNKDDTLCVKDFSCNNGDFEYILEDIIFNKQNNSYKPAQLKLKSPIRDLIQNDANLKIYFNEFFKIYREHFFFILETSPDGMKLDDLREYIKTMVVSFDNIDGLNGYMRSQYENLPKALDLYINLQKKSYDFYKFIKKEFDSLNYIGPIRAIADRDYRIGSHENVGLKGEHAVQIIEEKYELQKECQDILKNLGIANKIEISKLSSQNFEFKIKTDIIDNAVNFADVGCGTSQILPIIVQSLFSNDDNSMIIIEQPEVHLHPKVQADLASLFVESIQYGKKFLIETHSEYFIERIRTCILKNPKLANDVIIYYVDQNKEKKQSEITEIKINTKGQYSTLPKGYLTNFRMEEIDAQLDLISEIYKK